MRGAGERAREGGVEREREREGGEKVIVLAAQTHGMLLSGNKKYVSVYPRTHMFTQGDV